EAKEGVPVQRENQTLASITFQNLFRMYGKLSGMTGTADTEAFEFNSIYGLEVVVIPTHRPMIRIDHPDAVFLNRNGKYRAVANEIKDCFDRGQPVLVGTTSIEGSELLSNFLREQNVPHEVLNAKQHEREAQIIANAGRPKAVTIATNMAGRGTDIEQVGASAIEIAEILPNLQREQNVPNEVLTAKQHAREAQIIANAGRRKAVTIATNMAGRGTDIVLGGSLATELTALAEDASEADKARVREEWQKRHDEVVALGGLHILGTERHESRRIDNQLRGRSGRQGDPGSSRFYLSLEDNLMRIFAADWVQRVMARMGLKEDDIIE